MAKKKTSELTTFTAGKDFEYWGNEYNKGDTVTPPDGWVLDESHNESLQMQDKKSAARSGGTYQQRRAAFTNGRNRAILPVIING